MQSQRRFYPNWDHADVNESKLKGVPLNIEHQVPLYRYVHMNDEENTQIFTFLLLPHLLCGLLDEVESKPFIYGQNLWTVRFQRSEAHLGVFLELKPAMNQPAEEHSNRTVSYQFTEQDHGHSVSLDFQFTLKNREHFSRNETYGRTGCVFCHGQSRHGRKRFVDLVSLSSRRHTFDDGLCVIELEMKNPNIVYNLWCDACADPTVTNHYDRRLPHSSSVISLMRLDGSIVTIEKLLHFESERFFYAESQWYLTLDLETSQWSSNDCGNHSQPNVKIAEEPSIVVHAEMSLVKEVRKRTDNSSRATAQVKRCHSISNRVKCIASLPGGCVTKMMEFSIGSQGWPTQAYRTTFRNGGGKAETDQITNHKNQRQHSAFTCIDQRTADKDTGDTQSTGSGSPIALLLACASSPVNIKLQMTSFTNLSFVEVPVLSTTARATPPYLSDPFNLPWHVYTSESGKLLRLKFQPVLNPSRWENSEVPQCPLSHPAAIDPRSPDAVCLVGCRLRIHPLTPQLHAYVLPVGPALVHLIRFTSDRGSSHNLPASDKMPDECESYAPVSGMHTGKRFHTDHSSPGKKKMIMTDDDAIQSFHSSQGIALKKDDICEVAMNVTVAEVNDKNTGLINPMNGTILVEIEWVYNHVILIDRFHAADLINARQYHQLKYELDRLRKERDELERQLMSREMGLIQIDPAACQGPRSMVPIEPVAAVRSSAEEDRSSLLSRSLAPASAPCSIRDQIISVEPRAPKRRSHVQVDYRELRGSSHSAYRDSYGSNLESVGRSDEHFGFVRGPPRYSFDNESNMEKEVHLENRSASKSSVNSDHIMPRLPDRRKQFGRSKMTWKTYECARIQSLAEPFPAQPLRYSGPAYWQRPPSRRVQEICSGGARSATSSAGCSPRSYFQNYDELGFFD